VFTGCDSKKGTKNRGTLKDSKKKREMEKTGSTAKYQKPQPERSIEEKMNGSTMRFGVQAGCDGVPIWGKRRKAPA